MKLFDESSKHGMEFDYRKLRERKSTKFIAQNYHNGVILFTRERERVICRSDIRTGIWIRSKLYFPFCYVDTYTSSRYCVILRKPHIEIEKSAHAKNQNTIEQAADNDKGDSDNYIAQNYIKGKCSDASTCEDDEFEREDRQKEKVDNPHIKETSLSQRHALLRT
ncbi:unnamed protein product [Albugo candida]|uniref:Uncharacterized protein n=1 Tax=Albugo candida TaxID=65357 RepID=A0A024FUJ5_9STRA|nr:unnamed protein product [Albugo candida]|eukprot:CCI10572.1 unnamed protein product [Albugo candida]